MAEYSTGESNLKLKFTSEKTVSIDYVVSEANSIWRETKKRKITFGDVDSAEALMREMQNTHPEFCKSYPIVNRYICQMQEYSAKAFRLWLKKIEQKPWKTEAEYLDAQADYVTILFKIKKPRANKTEINNIRTNIRAMLQKEHDTFKNYAQEFSKEVTEEEKILAEKNAAELREFAAIAGPAGLAKARHFVLLLIHLLMRLNFLTKKIMNSNY